MGKKKRRGEEENELERELHGAEAQKKEKPDKAMLCH